MPVCTRCHNLNCRGNCAALGLSLRCATCGSSMCKGNCSRPIGQKGTSMLRCCVCGLTYWTLHTASECTGRIAKYKAQKGRGMGY